MTPPWRRDEVLARVPSLSDPIIAYDVVRRPDGTIACECQAYPSWRKRGLDCWHVRIYKSAAKATARCQDLAERRGVPHAAYGVCLPCLLRLLATMAAAVKTKYVPRPEKKPRRRPAARKKQKE